MGKGLELTAATTSWVLAGVTTTAKSGCSALLHRMLAFVKAWLPGREMLAPEDNCWPRPCSMGLEHEIAEPAGVRLITLAAECGITKEKTRVKKDSTLTVHIVLAAMLI